MSTARASSTDPTPSPESVHRLVLLAEDDPDLRELMAGALRGDGYTVIELGNGLELLEELQRLRASDLAPDLVVSDIRMPGLGGLQTLSRLREWSCMAPVILVTAFAFEETLTNARALGAAIVLNKPFCMSDLRIAANCFAGHSAAVNRGTPLPA
jgi:CheY-like chemotaxis protein